MTIIYRSIIIDKKDLDYYEVIKPIKPGIVYLYKRLDYNCRKILDADRILIQRNPLNRKIIYNDQKLINQLLKEV